MTKIKARILHTMLRVKNLEASIEFYTGNLGMNLIGNDTEIGDYDEIWDKLNVSCSSF